MGQWELGGAAQDSPAGEHEESRDGRPRPSLHHEGPENVKRLHSHEHLRSCRMIVWSFGSSSSSISWFVIHTYRVESSEHGVES